MAYALIASGKGTQTTAAIDTTGANLIVVVMGGPSATLTDNKSNTFTARTEIGGALRIWYAYNPTVGIGHTFTAANTYNGVGVAAFSGAAASPYDKESGVAWNAPPSSTSVASPPWTPAENNELIVGGLVMGASDNSPSIDSGFTVLQSIASSPGVVYGMGIAYKIQTTATAEDPTWTWVGGGSDGATTIAAFKAAAVVQTQVVQRYPVRNRRHIGRYM
jgi:hypothetical protein